MKSVKKKKSLCFGSSFIFSFSFITKFFHLIQNDLKNSKCRRGWEGQNRMICGPPPTDLPLWKFPKPGVNFTSRFLYCSPGKAQGLNGATKRPLKPWRKWLSGKPGRPQRLPFHHKLVQDLGHLWDSHLRPQTKSTQPTHLKTKHFS